MDFSGKVTVVTGGAQGLGRAIAEAFAQEGSDIAILDINQQTALASAKDVAARFGRKVLSYTCDVTDAQEVTEIAQAVKNDFGKVDILVSNAGILIAGGVDEISPENWEKVIRINLIGFFHVCRAFVPVMREQTSGCIIQINSKSGKSGSYKNSAYCAGKFGGIGAVQSFALELAQYNIRVNAVCPGNLLDSPLWQDSIFNQYVNRLGLSKEEVRARYESKVPLGNRGCVYEDVTPVVLFLASESARYMTGQAINVTGGQEMH
ncbi:MAG: sorbitol-6-phosphate dehydrogenase [Planctomycetota bacterium]